eukprot:6733122-Pyramimonas_sp.AAC.1
MGDVPMGAPAAAAPVKRHQTTLSRAPASGLRSHRPPACLCPSMCVSSRVAQDGHLSEGLRN